MAGHVTKRCNCRGADGKTLGKKCPELAKRGHGAHWVRYEVPGGPDGKRRRPWAGPYPNETMAKEELRRLVTDAESGMPVPDRNLTVRAYLRKHWLPSKKRLKDSTLQSYREIVDLYADPGLGHLKLRLLRENHLDELYEAMGQINNLPKGEDPSEMLRRLLATRARADWRENKGLHSSRPLSPARIHLAHRVLSSALSYAFKTRKIGHDPSKHVEPPRVVRPKPMVWTGERVERWIRTGKVPGPVMVWTPQIAGEFLDHCEEKHERLYPLYHLVGTRGLRRGDVRRMEWPDVDLEAGTLSIVQAADGSQGPKTDAGVHTITLGAENVALLKAWRVRQKRDQLRAGEGWVGSEIVFTRRNGEPLKEEFVSQRFEILIGRAKLPPIRFHDLRHCAATFGLAAGVDMKVISATLGHSRHSFTADTYTSVVPELADAAAEATVAIIPRKARKTGG